MKKAIQFGAGNIGRGFIGAVLSRAGYHVTFVDVNKNVIDAINKEGRYTVHVKDVECEEILITDVSAVLSNTNQIVDEIATADIITTAVGLGILRFIAPAIADGISERKRQGLEFPLNIIACENGIRATSQLKKLVYGYLADDEKEWCASHVGFADSAVDRIVPPIPTIDPIDIVVEKFYEWVIEKNALVGPALDIPGVILADNILAYNERKLFTLNTGHSMAAFLGQAAGYHTIGKAISDEKIFSNVRAVMQQSGEGLVRKFGFDHEKHFQYIETILNRFQNPFMSDEVTRVGRQPLRKLSRNDRFVEPMMIARSYGLPYDRFVLGIAAALCFENPGDPETVEMHEMIGSMGLKGAILKITSLDPEDPVVDEIIHVVEVRFRSNYSKVN